MHVPRSVRSMRAMLAAGLLVAGLAIPATALADTTGGPPGIQPAGSRDATISIDSVAVVGKVVATVRISVICQPFDSFDWETGQTTRTTDGSVEGGSITILQAQGRTLDYGTQDTGGRAICDGTTVNRYEVPVSAAVAPWKTGTAVVGATIYIADLASFQDSDAASSGPVTVRLANK